MSKNLVCKHVVTGRLLFDKILQATKEALIYLRCYVGNGLGLILIRLVSGKLILDKDNTIEN